MNKFTYGENQYSLHYSACDWLTVMGLRETRWILDSDWIIFSCHLTYKQWMKMK